MKELVSGQEVQHKVYGDVELYGFVSVGDTIEVAELTDDPDRTLDVVLSVNAQKVEFLDENGHKHVEPLELFYEHADLTEY